MSNNLSNDVSAMIFKDVERTADDAAVCILSGDNLFNAGKYRGALSCYLRSLMIKRNSKAYFGAGLSYKFLNEYDKAIKNFQKSAEISPNNYETHYETGICYLLKSKPENALECFQRSIMLDKTNPEVQLQLALTHELLNEEDMAMKIYDMIIEHHPEYVKAWSHKAALLICRGEYLNACKIFFEILKVNPNFYRAYLGLAVCFDNIKKISDAKRFYLKFLKMCPDSSHSDYVKNRVSMLKKQNQKRPDYMSLV